VPKSVDLNIVCTAESVASKLCLQSHKSAGPDGLHPMLLKNCAEAVAEPLSIIFRKSFETGEVPANWKTASIMPIYFQKPSQPTVDDITDVVSVFHVKSWESLIKEHGQCHHRSWGSLSPHIPKVGGQGQNILSMHVTKSILYTFTQ